MQVAESADFFNQRLLEGRRGSPQRLWGKPLERVTRRVCMRIARGTTQVIPSVDHSVVVHCASGSVWITHDGDPKDVVLDSHQSYHADREQAMHMHALAPCVVEIEFEDEAGAS